MLQHAGVEIIAYDIHPPPPNENGRL
jgi:hypothetical protein